jgi:hypothetical protein
MLTQLTVHGKLVDINSAKYAVRTQAKYELWVACLIERDIDAERRAL